jgi:adenosylcobinamide hydrolase
MLPPRILAEVTTRYCVTDGTLVIDLEASKRVLSSAPHGGGWRLTRYILNHQVDGNSVATHEHPSRSLGRLARRLGVDERCVGLMTAVPMTQLVTRRVESREVWVECFATVGVTNAVRAGEPCHLSSADSPAHKVGTINLIVITNACLSSSAMVAASQVITESKTGVLRDHAVPSWTGASGATGTGTDVVVVACGRQGEGPWVPYSGTHTEIGAMIGRVVSECMRQGLERAAKWATPANGIQ